MSLEVPWTGFCNELDILSDQFRDFATSKPSLSSAAHFDLKDECLLEGLLSRFWQAWGRFCRSCIVESCLGTTTVAGVGISALSGAASEAHVSGAAIRARKVSTNVWGTTNSTLRHEPTWGDVDVLATTISRLDPGNRAQLLAAFSGGSQSAKAIQTIRNAASHHNSQTMTEVGALRPKYIVFQITHPTQSLYWIEPSSQDFLVIEAARELRQAALAAVS